jgi:hypothetical protein
MSPELAQAVDLVKELQGAFLDPYVIVDHERKICAFNRAFHALFSRRVARTLEGRALHEVISFRLQGGVFDLSRECVEREAALRYDEIEGHGEEGARWNMIAAATPLLGGGRCVGALLVLRDVTDEVKIQAKYRDMVGGEEEVRVSLEETLSRRTEAMLSAHDELNRLQERLSRFERGLELPAVTAPGRG